MGWRRLTLFCPSVSKAVQIIAWDDQKLDIGSIARSFGLDANTLKLNGHFISRGADLIASSVTWKSLIRFFAARSLSTGDADSDALVVDGKLSRIGYKRSLEAEDHERWMGCDTKAKRTQFRRETLSETTSNRDRDEERTIILKRRVQSDQGNCLKRRKVDQSYGSDHEKTRSEQGSAASYLQVPVEGNCQL